MASAANPFSRYIKTERDKFEAQLVEALQSGRLSGPQITGASSALRQLTSLAQQERQPTTGALKQAGQAAMTGLVSPETIERGLYAAGDFLAGGARQNLQAQQESRLMGDRELPVSLMNKEELLASKEHAISAGDPQTAQQADFRLRNVRGGAEMLSTLATSPLGIATLGVGPALAKAPAAARTLLGSVPALGFSAMGAEQATAPRQPEETEADVLQRQLGGAGMTLLGGVGARTLPRDVAPIIKSGVKIITNPQQAAAQLAQGILNRGAGRARGDFYNHRLSEVVRSHLQEVATRYKGEHQRLYQEISPRIAKAFPDGITEIAAFQKRLTNIMGESVQTPENLPKVVRDLLATPRGGQESLEAQVLREIGGRIKDIPLAAGRKDASSATIRGELPTTPGEKTHWTFEEVQQFRSRIGEEAFGKHKSGPVRRALIQVYDDLTGQMKNAAKATNLTNELADANKTYKHYIDSFVERSSRLAKMLKGKNASQILGPITNQATARQVQESLASFRKYGLDFRGALHAGKTYNIIRMGSTMAEVTKWELILAPLTGGLSLLKPLPGRALQRPGVARHVARPSDKEIRLFNKTPGAPGRRPPGEGSDLSNTPELIIANEITSTKAAPSVAETLAGKPTRSAVKQEAPQNKLLENLKNLFRLP